MLWFVATAVVTVWFVFRDPRFDYRLLIVGSVLPLLDGVTGGAAVFHTLAFSLVLLALIMVLTVGHRRARQLLARAADRDAAASGVRWCLGGQRRCSGGRSADRPSTRRLPEVARGGWTVALELAGAVILAWVWRASNLSDPTARRLFWQQGRLFSAHAQRQ